MTSYRPTLLDVTFIKDNLIIIAFTVGKISPQPILSVQEKHLKGYNNFMGK